MKIIIWVNLLITTGQTLLNLRMYGYIACTAGLMIPSDPESMMLGVSHTLKDIRPRAEEKARRKAGELREQSGDTVRPPGTGFETERARAKQALRDEVNPQTRQSVRKIAATSSMAVNDDRILRVAAYCRVSTDDIDQVISIELQKNNYRDMIKANPKWRYVGTYVDV